MLIRMREQDLRYGFCREFAVDVRYMNDLVSRGFNRTGFMGGNMS